MDLYINLSIFSLLISIQIRKLREDVREKTHENSYVEFCNYEKNTLKLEQQNDNTPSSIDLRELREIQRKYDEQAELIDTLRRQLRDNEDLVSYYENLNGEEKQKSEPSNKSDSEIHNTHNLSFEIQQATSKLIGIIRFFIVQKFQKFGRNRIVYSRICYIHNSSLRDIR